MISGINLVLLTVAWDVISVKKPVPTRFLSIPLCGITTIFMLMGWKKLPCSTIRISRVRKADSAGIVMDSAKRPVHIEYYPGSCLPRLTRTLVLMSRTC
jgi:hypothetical protein